MALLFMDGFDHYAIADIEKKWDAASAGLTIQSTVKRTGTGALQGGNSSTARYVQKGLDVGGDGSVVVGFGLQISAYHAQYIRSFVQFYNAAGDQANLTVNLDGSVSIRRGTTVLQTTSAGGVIPTNNWVYVEAKVLISDTGNWVVRVNGDTVLSGNGDTKESGDDGCTAVRLNFLTAGSPGPLVYYDDLYILDLTGTYCNDFLGDSQVDTIYPDGEGSHSQWSRSEGDYNYQCVNEPGAIDTDDYVYSESAGNVDTYSFGTLVPLNVDVVHAVAVTPCSRKMEAGDIGIQGVFRVGGTNYSYTRKTVSDDFRCTQHIRERTPAGAAWDKAAVDGAQFGIEMVS